MGEEAWAGWGCILTSASYCLSDLQQAPSLLRAAVLVYTMMDLDYMALKIVEF